MRARRRKRDKTEMRADIGRQAYMQQTDQHETDKKTETDRHTDVGYVPITDWARMMTVMFGAKEDRAMANDPTVVPVTIT